MSSVVDADEYLMACVRCIEMNPVRARMVNKPELYQWSSSGERMSGVAGEMGTDLFNAELLQRHLRYIALPECRLQQHTLPLRISQDSLLMR